MGKNIAFILSSLDAGGAQRVVCVLANKLVHNHNIVIIVFYRCPIFYDLDPRIKIVFCKPEYVHKKYRTIIHSIFMHTQLIRKIKKQLKINKTDIVIGFMTTASVYSIIASKLLNIRCVISERVHPEYSSINSFWIKIRRVFYPHAHMLVVQTQAIKNYFSGFIAEDKIVIIKNPLDQYLSDARAFDDIKENIILNVGRLEHQKNQEMLIRAFANLNIKNWTLIIVGEGEKRKKLESLIEQLNIKTQVILTGNVNNVYDFYNKSKIFAFTSRFEGFPNALTEAMHYGLACISTNCPSGPSDLIKNNENGILIPVGDQEALENGLKKLVNNPNLRSIYGQKAVEATNELDVETITRKWLEIFKINN